MQNPKGLTVTPVERGPRRPVRPTPIPDGRACSRLSGSAHKSLVCGHQLTVCGRGRLSQGGGPCALALTFSLQFTAFIHPATPSLARGGVGSEGPPRRGAGHGAPPDAALCLLEGRRGLGGGGRGCDELQHRAGALQAEGRGGGGGVGWRGRGAEGGAEGTEG